MRFGGSILVVGAPALAVEGAPAVVAAAADGGEVGGGIRIGASGSGGGAAAAAAGVGEAASAVADDRGRGQVASGGDTNGRTGSGLFAATFLELLQCDP